MTDVGKAIRSALLTARHIAAPLTHEHEPPEGYADGGAVDPAMPEPNKTVKAYKLFRHKNGKLFPLYVNANKEVPVGRWLTAEAGPQGKREGRVKSKLGDLAYRPGWHSGDYPVATHIGSKSSPGLKAPDTRPPEHVWAEVEHPADVDWQKVADSRARTNASGVKIPVTAHITDQVPHGGFYRYKTNANMHGHWLISGGMKVNRVLSDDEVRAINSETGVHDLPRRGGFARGGPAPAQIRNEPASAPVKPSENKDEDLFDYSRLSEVPKVPQLDLPRYEPARGVSDRVKDLVKHKKVKHKMLETIQHGLDKGGANWYNTDPLRDEFIKHLGPREGDAAHRQYMEFVASTSPRSEVGANARNASYYYQRHMSGQGMPAVGDKNPQPYGHIAQRLHQMNAQRVTSAGGWDPLNNPKSASFVENLSGNQRPATIDTHAFRLPAIHAQDPRFLETAYESVKGAPRQNIQQQVERGETSIKKVRPAHWQSAPKDNEYGAMEKFYQGLAKELNITPAQAQAAAAWVGGGKLTGLASDESKPFLRFLQDRVYKTAREVNMDPKDVLKDFITGKIPLRADGGPVTDPAAPQTQVPVPSRGKPSIAAPVQQPRAFNGAGMYSHAVEEALRLPQVRGAPQQLLASLKGIKQEELANANPLQKFGGQRSVTREELADHFRQAMPRIHESEFNDHESEDPDELTDARFKEYTIPGGRNYRELLLHLPETQADENDPELTATRQRMRDANEERHRLAAQGLDNDAATHEWAKASREHYALAEKKAQQAKAKDFHYEEHWPTANVLAHLRLSDRESPVGGPKSPIWYRHINRESGYVGKPFPTMEALEQDAGKYPESVRKQLEVQPTAGPKEKITHMEELQSDWGQQGRENGFRDPNFDVEKGKETLAQLHRDMAVREHHALTTGADYNSLPGAENDRQIDELTQKLEHHKRAVPHGPYVTSTNGWTDLGLKRALLEAARNGSDRLAWTPGQEQADRYGLAKHYANLNWHRGFEYGTKPGEGTLVAYRHGYGGGAAPAVWQTMHEDELPEHIGAEFAQRLLSQPEHKALEGVTSQRLEGDDLKVGGEGMKAYYDKIVPGRLKEILKKLGHEAKFEPLTITHKPKNNTPPGPHNMRTTLHSVHLPPELRDKIKKGLPAFAKGGAVKTPVTMRAAGVILRDPEDRVLFVKRNPKGGDHGGEWAFPGGKIERGETPAQAAVRETHEEIGHKIEGSLKQVDARVSKEGVHFTTFDHRVGKQFAPKLNEEHSEFRWAHPNSAPSPLHPGAKATLTKGPARAYAAGGGVHYDTHQDGPFWRVARREDGAHPSLQRRAGPEVRGPGGAPDGGAAGPVGGGDPQSPAARRLAQLQAVANRHAAAHGRGPVVDAGNSESSLHKQSAIGRAFQLAATDHPGYKRAVFAAYQRQHPELVREARARNYDELRHAAYTKLGHEVKQQFDDLPVRTSYHRHGEGDYESSKHMRHDVLENGHLNVFQGGDRHDFLHHVDPRTQLNENEMFRAIHDAYGHALHGSGFGAKGEERAWNAHRQMFSPLAALAMSAETRGQNSFVNYTPINAELTAAKHEKEAQIARAKRFGDAEAVKQHEKDKKDIMSGWKYAPQRAVLLPPEMVDPKYEGGMPDYLQHLIKPEPGTGLSSPITHFSPSPDVKELDPGRYGTGIKGDERARVLKRPGGVKERVYGYLGAPNQVKPEPGLGPYAYAGQANDLYDLTHDPVRLGLLATEANRSNPLGNFNPGVVNTAQAQNDTERMAKEHGYSGVANPKAAYPMAAVFGKVPVTPAAGSDVVDRALEMTRRRSTP